MTDLIAAETAAHTEHEKLLEELSADLRSNDPKVYQSAKARLDSSWAKVEAAMAAVDAAR